MPVSKAMLDKIDEAIASTPWYIPSAPVLYLTGRREVAGIYGTRVNGAGDQPVRSEMPDWGLVEPTTHPGETFVWTRREAKRMRKALRQEAQRLAQR